MSPRDRLAAAIRAVWSEEVGVRRAPTFDEFAGLVDVVLDELAARLAPETEEGERSFEWGFRLDGHESWAHAHSDGTWWPATDPRRPGVRVNTPDLDAGFSVEQLLGYLPSAAVLLRRTIRTIEGPIDEFPVPGDRQAPGRPE